MLDFNDLEWCAIGVAGVLLICLVLAEWLLGQVGCCGQCDQGRKCKCQGK